MTPSRRRSRSLSTFFICLKLKQKQNFYSKKLKQFSCSCAGQSQHLYCNHFVDIDVQSSPHFVQNPSSEQSRMAFGASYLMPLERAQGLLSFIIGQNKKLFRFICYRKQLQVQLINALALRGRTPN